MLSTVEKVLFLKTVDLFSAIPGSDLTHIAGVTEEEDLLDGDQFIHQGETGDSLFLIVDGEVEIKVSHTTVATLGERQVVGEMSILDSETRSADCFAKGPTTLLKLRKGEFDDIMAEKPEIARGILKVLTGRLRQKNVAAAKQD